MYECYVVGGGMQELPLPQHDCIIANLCQERAE